MSTARPSSIRDSTSPHTQIDAPSPRSAILADFSEPHANPEAQDLDRTSERDADEDNDISYPEPTSEQTLLPPPNFNPFFTLIEDSASTEHYHPYVHYVFADDDPIIVTAAAMRSLGLDDTQYLPDNTPEGDDDTEKDDERDEQHQDGQVESPLPPPIPGVRERYLLVDIAADGHTVLDAKAMSADWQITGAQVRAAPSFDEASPDHGRMLKIQGVDMQANRKAKAKGKPGETKLKEARERAQGDVFAALDELVKGVEGGLAVATKIAGSQEDARQSERTLLAEGPSTVIDAGIGE